MRRKSLTKHTLRRKSTIILLSILLCWNNLFFHANVIHSLASSGDPSLKFALRPKVFKLFPYEIPCVSDNNTKSFDTGLIYIKIQKCSSTTVASIFRKLMTKIGKTKQIPIKCKSHTKHGFAWTLPSLKKRDKQHSFLFTFVREPTSRSVSDFFYHGISKSGNCENNLQDFKKFQDHITMNFPGYGGYMLPYLFLDEQFVPPLDEKYLFWNPDEPNIVQNHELLEKRVEYILDSYDFIGLTERFDESLVALSLILNIEIWDILHRQELRSSGSWDFDSNHNKCFHMHKSDPADDIKSYLASAEWNARMAGDKLLYKSVNASLDFTISYLKSNHGNAFDHRLEIYHKMMHLTKEECGNLNCSHCSSTGDIIQHIDRRCGTCIHKALMKLK